MRTSTILFMILLAANCARQIESPPGGGEYLGEEPPGIHPKIFAPGTISTDASEGCISFANDGSFVLIGRYRDGKNGIFYSEINNGLLSEPAMPSFSILGMDADFMLAPDGRTLFFASGRAKSSTASPTEDHQIWKTEKTASGWTEPALLPAPINSSAHDSFPCLSSNEAFYFFSSREGGYGKRDIYRCVLDKRGVSEFENLGKPINSPYHEVDPFIARDESLLIFCSDRPGGYGGCDFYICFQQPDNSWTAPLNMGPEINSPGEEYIPYISPDKRFFFFTSNKTGNREVYWVDTGIIDDMRPDAPLDL